MDLHHIFDANEATPYAEDEHSHAREIYERLRKDGREQGTLDAETEARFESRVRDSLSPFSRPPE